MDNLSRRSFVAFLSAAPLCFLANKFVVAPTKAEVRSEAYSPQGQVMLKTYAEAVEKMMNTGEGEPVGWLFQWYTHWVKGSTSKSAEITRVYGASAGANKDLAQDMWDTCQAHGPSEDENFFLPWHRMFVYYFEEIVRHVVSPKPFALPYWNYSTAANARHGIMPPEFRTPNTTANSLYRTSRNSAPNVGTPIDETDVGALDLTALSQPSYSPNGAAPGFCQDLDVGLHGNVHVLIGNSKGMGSVPWAAYDPIFWMHHCNIDRLWASWNKNGGKNPTTSAFLDKEFIFADKFGRKVTGVVKDFLDIEKLGYTYDEFEPRPVGFSPAAATKALAAAIEPRSMASAVARNVALTSGTVRVNLQLAPAIEGAVGPLDERIRTLAPDKHLYVVLRELHADAQPEVLYHVYLNLPQGITPNNGGDYYVGTINFFEAAAHGSDHNMETPASGTSPKFYGLNATQVAKRLQNRGLLKAQPSLSIVASGSPVEQARPVIGEVLLVTQ
jgi:tyrosinase